MLYSCQLYSDFLLAEAIPKALDYRYKPSQFAASHFLLDTNTTSSMQAASFHSLYSPQKKNSSRLCISQMFLNFMTNLSGIEIATCRSSP